MEEDVCEIYARQCELDHRERRYIRFGSNDFRPVLLVSRKESCLGAEQIFPGPITKSPVTALSRALKGYILLFTPHPLTTPS